MTRKYFFMNLWEACEFHEADIDTDEMKKFLDLNFDEDSSLANWTWSDFNSFAIDIKTEGLRRACHLSDLKHWEDEEDE